MIRTQAAFDRLHDRLFDHFGEQAVLRGGEAVRVILTDNIELIGEYGEVAQTVTTGTFAAQDRPTTGDALLAGGKAWRLDRELRGDARIREFILRSDLP